MSLRDARYRLADRIGRFLAGGRIDRLEERLAANERELAALRASTPRAGEGPNATVPTPPSLPGLDPAVPDALARSRLTQMARFLAESTAGAAAVSLHGIPDLRLSIALAVRDRAALLPRAIESVLAQSHPNWELLVVDDGSEDDSLAVARRFESDARVRVFSQPWRGISAARNVALAAATGEVVTYLDSDVTYFPGYLKAVARTFASDPRIEVAYAGQLVSDLRDGAVWIRYLDFDRERLRDENLIDANSLSHRRELVQSEGGFDEELPTVEDWELVLRYTARRAPTRIPVLGSLYEIGRNDQKSLVDPNGHAICRIRERHFSSERFNGRILYALFHHPQLTETYIESELATVRRAGAEVAAWGADTPAVAYPSDVPVLDGGLAGAIERFDPDLVHVHWLNIVWDHREALAAAGVPVTVKGHGYDLSEDLLDFLEAQPWVRKVFLPPYWASVYRRHRKIQPLATSFDAGLYRPPVAPKERRLVARAAAGLATRNLDSLIELARRRPEFRFVLAAGRVRHHENWVDGLVERNRAAGAPLEIRIDASHAEAAELVARAGIYLHTHTLEQPFGAPISIAEAMATGAFVLAPRCASSASYLGDAGGTYGSLEEAEAILLSTLDWPEMEWRGQAKRAIDRAFAAFESGVATRPLLAAWRELIAPRATIAHAPEAESAARPRRVG